MSHTFRVRWSLIALSMGLAGFGFIAGRLSAAAPEKPTPGAAPATRPAERFFELRVYTAAPGKLDALHKRFRDHAVPSFAKHGIKSIGYWTAVDETHQGKLYYVIAYPDRASREKMLINGIGKDPEFLRAVAESEKNGKLTAEVESVLMTPTDYSPIK